MCLPRTVRAITVGYSVNRDNGSCESCTADLGSIFAEVFLDPTRTAVNWMVWPLVRCPATLLLPGRNRLTVTATGHTLTSVLRLGCFHGLAVA